ncbi:putative glucokinase regulator family protein [Cladophialophora carrionii]|uniref:N-acetyl-D-glucosamine kinase n=1 Tax=Cladophialophora carrionii TaxID=86049 RepID=A0A1C1D2V7_9EURO|nr:putative glucokinase regulator family protein [Cladophialophora carrionii]
MAALNNLADLQTEQRNCASSNIDQVSTLELCHIINVQDATIADSVAECIPTIAAAIDCLAGRVRAGGRVVYVGAGTSGRLGILDASEIPPTFSSPEGQFVGIIAGGEAAIRHAQEGAEDDVDAAVQDLEALHLDGQVDSLVGIAASGRTPYVLSCLSYAKRLGCATVGVACTEPSAMSRSHTVDYMISPVVGPEVVTGSTRMKAGTATKLVLNMLSTGTMIKLGKTFGNMMVDLKATNLKLQQRSRNILRTVCGLRCPTSDDDLDILLHKCHGSVKLAIASLSLGVSVSEAERRLDEAGGVLADLLKQVVDLSLPDDSTNQRYHLCIDGGGSKCAAAVISVDGESGHGESSGCNVTDVGVEASLASISSAIQGACDTMATLKGKSWRPRLFSSVWIALAGHDRKQIATIVDKALEDLFARPQGPGLTITNDIELLAIPAAEKHNVDSSVVLVAGTGSVAMSFQRQKGRFVRTGRSGGWGHLLGDDGSGFDIGRRAIRVALAALEGLDTAGNQEQGLVHQTASHVESLILDHFRPPGTPTRNFDLLSTVLTWPSELEKKRRIAQVARLVIEASKCDHEAKMIVDGAVEALVRLLTTLPSSGQIDSQSSVLVLGGGLMQSPAFSNAVLQLLGEQGTAFKHVEVVDHPASSGVKYLLHKRRDRAWIGMSPRCP